MKNINLAMITASLFLLCGCNKFLDARPDNSMIVPTTIVDFQALLDNDANLNGSPSVARSSSSNLGFIGAEDFFIPKTYESRITSYGQNSYTWAKNIYTTTPVDDWGSPYFGVSNANTAIIGVKLIPKNSSNLKSWNNVLGSALFFRAFYFFQLAEVFAPSYTASTANKDIGIPLRLGNDINEQITRSNLEVTYARIIEDLNEAQTILPDFPTVKTRPSKTAVYALLARVYLAMRDYELAKLNADKCLQMGSSLIDYNSLNENSAFSFSAYNEETIFFSIFNGESRETSTMMNSSLIRVDSTLYQSYNNNDLRKILFFALQPPIGYRFRGSYSGSKPFFNGLASDEMYLIRAECNARFGDTKDALNDLNVLLKKRWRSGSYIEVTAKTSTEALSIILSERRKELIFRGVRWSDLRRLNKEGANISQSRIFNGVNYILPPNDKRYVYPIPPEVIGFNPDMPQNLR